MIPTEAGFRVQGKPDSWKRRKTRGTLGDFAEAHVAFSKLPFRKLLEALRLHHEGRHSHRENAHAVVA